MVPDHFKEVTMANAITTQNRPPAGLELKLTQALKGLQTVLPQGGGLQIGTTTLTQAQLVAKVQADLAPFEAARAEKTLYLNKLQAKVDSEAASREFLAQLKGALIAFLGRGNPLLADFGFNPVRTKVLTSAAKVLAAAKRSVTRQKRGTLGSKQKQAIRALGTPAVTLGAGGTTVVPAVVDTPRFPLAGAQAPGSGEGPAVAPQPPVIPPRA